MLEEWKKISKTKIQVKKMKNIIWPTLA
jgi:hypothetical protein